MTYRYTQTPYKAQKTLYMYTPFEGEAFLAAYAQNRALLAKYLQEATPPPSVATTEAPCPDGTNPLQHTEGFLARLATLTPEEGQDQQSWVDILIKKFETTRVIKTGYDASLKPLSGDEISLLSYARFGNILGQQRQPARQNLRALSCLLKLNDYLATRLAEFSTPEACEAYHASLALEQAAVELLWASPRTSPDPAPEGNRISDGAPERTSPQVMSDVICLLAETGRSRAYLDAMACHRLVPAAAILVKAPSAVSSPVEPRPSERFDNTTPVDAVLARMGIPTTVIEAESINDASVTEALRQFHQPYVIFSGPSGAVLGPSFFGQGKHYLHVHPGQLPQYRGSTPMYYSLLKEQRLVATALFLEQAIDTGEVLMSRSFAIPEDPMAIDQDYDPWMRAQTLVAVLEEYLREGRFHTTPQPQDQAETFFVIHPVLKHIAILQAQGNRIPHPEVLR